MHIEDRRRTTDNSPSTGSGQASNRSPFTVYDLNDFYGFYAFYVFYDLNDLNGLNDFNELNDLTIDLPSTAPCMYEWCVLN